MPIKLLKTNITLCVFSITVSVFGQIIYFGIMGRREEREDAGEKVRMGGQHA